MLVGGRDLDRLGGERRRNQQRLRRQLPASSAPFSLS